MPFEQRAKMIDKYQSKLHKSKSSTTGNELTIGSYVSLKSLPLYNIGTIGITVKDGVPKIGQLNEHVFMFRDNKPFKFKIKTVESLADLSTPTIEMPPPTFSQSPDLAPLTNTPTPSIPLIGSLSNLNKHY